MKYYKCTYGLLITSLISGCSYFEPKQDKTEPLEAEQNVQQVSSSFKEKSLVEPTKKEVAIETFQLEDATATVNLTLNGTTLKSKQVVTWNDMLSGLILFKWVPPAGSSCKATTFPIKKYKNTNSLTYASRSLYDSNHRPCIGAWTVKIIEKPHKTLASEEIIVSAMKNNIGLKSIKGISSAQKV